MVCNEKDHSHCILDRECDSRRALKLIADKWAVLVVYTLSGGPIRYRQLQREVGEVSQKMLTQTLRGLECNGLVDRKVFPEVPPRVEYSLTPLGASLVEALKPLCEWTEQNFESVEEARNLFEDSRVSRE
ncbi:helix-turn-helix domain-containing protein [soil metagenome]